MSKLTSVEILELKLLGIVSFDSEVLRNKYKEQFKIAKEMEKEQIESGYGDGLNAHRTNFCNRQEYYNQTYKKEEK